MVAEPILFPMELAGEQKKEMELGIAMAALGLTLQKTGGNRIIMGYDLIPKKRGSIVKAE